MEGIASAKVTYRPVARCRSCGKEELMSEVKFDTGTVNEDDLLFCISRMMANNISEHPPGWALNKHGSWCCPKCRSKTVHGFGEAV